MLIFKPSEVCGQEPAVVGIILVPPNTYIDESTGECSGRNVARTTEILADYGMSYDIVCAPAGRIYRMVESKQIDLTITGKQVTTITPYVEFIDVPFRQISLNLYWHGQRDSMRTIAAVRGFIFAGRKQTLTERGYQFTDLPGIDAAVVFFLRNRTDALLSWQSSVDAYMQANDLSFPPSVQHSTLIKIETFFAITRNTPHSQTLKANLYDYATRNRLMQFLTD